MKKAKIKQDKETKKYYIEIPGLLIKEGKINLETEYNVVLFPLTSENKKALSGI